MPPRPRKKGAKGGTRVRQRMFLSALVRAKMPRGTPEAREALRSVLVHVMERAVTTAHELARGDGVETVSADVAERAVRSLCRAPDVDTVLNEARERYAELNE